ncbi:hypothetical protein AB6E21_10795, partial [Photobacterium swingsii]|uniref:hypothetical protein n=1 Tax=Photobacterium swingsii TaxID=680026 RepID=UPI0035504620
HLVWDQRVGGSNPSSPTTFKASSKDEAFFVQANVDLCSGWRSLAAHRSSVEWRVGGSQIFKSRLFTDHL